jgi:hypothetical protein
MIESGDHNKNRPYEPRRKVWHRNLTLEFDQQARYGGQLPHSVPNRVVCGSLNHSSSGKQLFHP